MKISRNLILLPILGFLLRFLFYDQAPWRTFPDLPEDLRPYRPGFLAILNDVFKDVKFPNFDVKSMIWFASLRTGLTDLKDETGAFVATMERLTKAMDEEAMLTFVGRTLARVQVELEIETRLKVAEYWYNKSSSKNQIRQPVFILGMPRSGSTFLHNLLSLDDDVFRAPRLWEIVDPTPPLGVRPGNNSFSRALRRNLNKLQTSVFQYLTPNLKAVHPIDSNNAEECMPILAIDGVSYHYQTIMNVESFQRWVMQQNQTGALQWHKMFLQVLQVEEDLTWLLKAPWHMNHVDAILQVYPDARIIVTHRNPSTMLASLASLLVRLHGVNSDDVRPKEIAKNLVDLWSEIVGRFVRFRKELQRTNNKLKYQIHDIKHDALSKDPLQAVVEAYKFMGMELKPQTELKMREWLQNDVKLGKKGAAGNHNYKPEWFGLDETELAKTPSFIEYSKEYCR